MCSTSVFTSIVTMVPDFAIVFVIGVLLYKLCFWKYTRFFVFSYDSSCSFVSAIIFFFSKLIIFIVHSLKDSQNFFVQSSPNTSCLFFIHHASTPANVDIMDIDYPQGICSPTVVKDDFSKLFFNHLFV